MNPFWAGFFIQLKEGGRSVSLFILTLAVLFGLILLSAVIPFNQLQPWFVGALPVMGFFALVWLCATIRRGRAWRRQRLGKSPLSVDELRKARSKLTKNNGSYRQNPA